MTSETRSAAAPGPTKDESESHWGPSSLLIDRLLRHPAPKSETISVPPALHADLVFWSAPVAVLELLP
jgi:hypothetical protein